MTLHRTSAMAGAALAGVMVAWSCDDEGGGFGGGGTPSEVPFGGGSGGDDTGTDTGSDTGADTGGDTGADTGGDTGADSGSDTGGDDTAALEGTGYAVGDVAYDLNAFTQTGALWSLYAQHGKPVVLVVGDADVVSMGSCMEAAAGVQASVAGVVVATLVGRDEYGSPSSQESAQRLAQLYGLDTVMYDAGGTLVSTWAERAPPYSYVIDADTVIRWTQHGAVTESSFTAALGDL